VPDHWILPSWIACHTKSDPVKRNVDSRCYQIEIPEICNTLKNSNKCSREMIFYRFMLPVDFGKRSAGPGRAPTYDQAAACNELLVQSRSTNPGLQLAASCVQRRAGPIIVTNFLQSWKTVRSGDEWLLLHSQFNYPWLNDRTTGYPSSDLYYRYPPREGTYRPYVRIGVASFSFPRQRPSLRPLHRLDLLQLCSWRPGRYLAYHMLPKRSWPVSVRRSLLRSLESGPDR